jgi:hypothetical protein
MFLPAEAGSHESLQKPEAINTCLVASAFRRK